MKRAAYALALVLSASAIVWYVWFQNATTRVDVQPQETVPVIISSNVVLTPATRDVGAGVPPIDVLPAAGPREEIVGIGAVLGMDKGVAMIRGTVPDSPAAEAGLAGNFLIRKIDDVVIEGMNLQDCVNLLRGPAGSKVRLELFDVDANEGRTVELTRRKIRF